MPLPRKPVIPTRNDAVLPTPTSPPTKDVSPCQNPPVSKRSKKQKPEAETFYDEDGLLWAIDPKYGKKYRVLEGASPEAVKAGKGGFDSLSALRAYVDEDVEGFDIDDLNGTAEAFLAHLRVPPDKEEMERLRKARALQQKRQDEEYANYVREDDEKDALQAQKIEEAVETRMEKRASRWARKKKKDK